MNRPQDVDHTNQRIIMKITPLVTLSALFLSSLFAFSKDAAQNKDRSKGHSVEAIIKKFDTDGDSKLAADELEKMREARKAKMQERRAKRLEKFDTDHDGKLSDQERAAIPKRHKNKDGGNQATPEAL
ncbi:MAG: hypothetical protein H8M99_12620 [Gloeobacteraceae cyanobacterium ES-bin-144]|nr:hypothetical protein [Verrucomicrobiales bacterium]